MGQLILFLLGLFAIGCVLYGVSAGVQMIQRGLAYMARSTSDGVLEKTPLSPKTDKTTDSAAVSPEPASAPSPAGSPMQHGIEELRALFALYQQGALTQAVFDELMLREPPSKPSAEAFFAHIREAHFPGMTDEDIMDKLTELAEAHQRKQRLGL